MDMLDRYQHDRRHPSTPLVRKRVFLKAVQIRSLPRLLSFFLVRLPPPSSLSRPPSSSLSSPSPFPSSCLLETSLLLRSSVPPLSFAFPFTFSFVPLFILLRLICLKPDNKIIPVDCPIVSSPGIMTYNPMKIMCTMTYPPDRTQKQSTSLWMYPPLCYQRCKMPPNFRLCPFFLLQLGLQ